MPQLPENPTTYFSPTAPEPQWRWRLEDSAGLELVSAASADAAAQRFPTQGDAESWLGESFHELADAGVQQVSLLEAERVVYGPMSLHP